MLHPAVTRFHITAAVALLFGTVAWLTGSTALFIMVVAAFFVLTGLGVAIPQLRFFGPYICRGDAAHPCVALTFDDGPDAQSTPKLLDFLRDARVEAAFFCVGKRIAANPELAARIVREGHLLENHSYTHSNATNFFTVGRLKSELTQTQAAIQEASGAAAHLFRPPMGLSNPRVFRAAHALGLTVVGWTARGLDTRTRQPERIVHRIVRKLKPGAIVLLHDGGIPADRLVATVKLLLDTVRARGYEVVRLDRMLK